jgi:hypothetical protein
VPFVTMLRGGLFRRVTLGLSGRRSAGGGPLERGVRLQL